MSISAITSSTTTSTSSINSDMKQRRDTFSALEKAISSGDLDSAKTAFATMKSDMEKMQAIRKQITGDSNNSSDSSNNPMAKAMETLSKALESGDTSSVQDAFSSLKETMKAGRKNHTHGQGDGDMPPPPPPSSTTNTTSNNNSDTLGSNIDVMA